MNFLPLRNLTQIAARDVNYLFAWDCL